MVYSQVRKLPAANSLVLRHLLCILCRIVRHEDVNKMTTPNLATCIAQCLLWDPNPASNSNEDQNFQAQLVNKLVEHLIVHAGDIWTDPAECIQIMSGDDVALERPHPTPLSIRTASSGSLSDNESQCTKGKLNYDGKGMQNLNLQVFG